MSIELKLLQKEREERTEKPLGFVRSSTTIAPSSLDWSSIGLARGASFRVTLAGSIVQKGQAISQQVRNVCRQPFWIIAAIESGGLLGDWDEVSSVIFTLRSQNEMDTYVWIAGFC